MPVPEKIGNGQDPKNNLYWDNNLNENGSTEEQRRTTNSNS